jgi:predicted outer membrane repeat protein
MTTKKSFLLIFMLLIGLLVSTQSLPAAAASIQLITDFESGEPADWFSYAGGGASVTTTFPTVADADPLARTGQVGNNTFVEATFNATSGFAGFGQDFANSGGAQDWSSFTAVSFWLYGNNTGQSFQFEIFDNRSDPNVDTAERFDTIFTDNFNGWQKVTIPFTDFTRATDFQPGGAPDDGLTLTEMWGMAVILDGSAGTLQIDDIGLERAIVDDFESGLPAGTDSDSNLIGFYKFEGPDAVVSFSTTDTPPTPVPGGAADNTVLQLDTNVPSGSWGGVVHAFENDAVDTWVTQDWSRFVGISFWLYGNNTGSTLFLDVLDNRAPNTTGDTAERYSIDIVDNFSGWQFFEIPFADLNRKEVGNGAPNDGLNLTAVHGWAIGVFSAGQAFSKYVDVVSLYGNADVPELAVGFTANNFDIDEGAAGQITVSLNRALGDDDPAQVSVDYEAVVATAVPDRDYIHPAAGTLTFIKGGPAALSFTLQTLDDSKYEGDERVILRLSNPVDVAPGFTMQAAATIVDNDNYDPLLIDDFERYPYLWDASTGVTLTNPEFAAGDALALPGQGAYEHTLEAALPLAVDISMEGSICNQGNGVIPIVLYGSDEFDVSQVDHTTVTLGDAYETHVDKNTGEPKRHKEDVNADGTMDLVFHFRFNETGLPCNQAVVPFNGRTTSGQSFTARGTMAQFGRDFPIGQNWILSEGMIFYYYGQGSGETITIELLDNRVPDPGPSGWSMVWSDEFNDPAGTPPNPANWGYEIGDGTVNGIPGWGNSELQYYTNSPDNAATDGSGNLVITAKEADGSLTCYYGPCEYTSARLISWHKVEFAYGRVESRILVPDGDAGLWPAFWSLGTDIDRVAWPQTGEIDIMEYVSRIPDEIFGTIHGPGYSGGSAYGNTYPFPGGVSNSYHTFAIEWQPDRIEWYVDGILYHTATPADVAPNEWVFNDPVFLLFNLAIGGNFGGEVSHTTTFPQEMAIDYVRVYQGQDTAERFETTFVDDFVGWQEVEIPFAALTRSAEQLAGAPNDGLTLTDVWGYGFKLPVNGVLTSALVDQVRLTAPTEVVVTNANDSGPGSLRNAIDVVANGGAVYFDPALVNNTITLTTGPLVVNKMVAIDAADAVGLTVSGGGADRVFVIDPTGEATISHLTIADGFGWQLAGGILNNGTLTLDHVTVTNNTMATDAGDFWQGGGGIYSGDGATLNLIDSTVANNTAGWSGGGVYSFFNTTTNVIRSTISGNVSNDVGGGLRLLGNAEIVNSTISGNTATGWYGGAIFVTDGVVNMTNATIANNTSPVWAPADVFVGTFGPSSATLSLTNSIVSSTQDNCFVAFFGAGAVTLATNHNNVFTDATCFVGASDQVVGDAGLAPLVDNGGPTLTHALLPGSAAIDVADTAVCPSTDQRGTVRDAACDVGAFEYKP